MSYLKNSETKKLFHILTQQSFADGVNYIDKEFSHEQVSEVDGKPIEWIYIKPSPDSSLFPDEQQPKKPEDDDVHCHDELPFVQFLRCLYSIQPNIFRRLFETSSNNVYSVWLFVEGSFEPIFIDGYFPLD